VSNRSDGPRRAGRLEDQAMMGSGIWNTPGMLLAMGIVWLLVIVDLVLVGAAAAKYLFFDRSRRSGWRRLP
jgi:hypothetical protein